jgi:protein-L-isoaspartate(D-aspartate) O-methyltransferase
MVRTQIAARGVRDPAVLGAMERVPREAFIGDHLSLYAYSDQALPIQEGQTISQPYIVALMAEALALKPRDRVLEIGTGSGYAAAVLSLIAAEVISVERIPSLAASARERLERLGYSGVRVEEGDGTTGWPGLAPYEAIQVTAGAPEIPPSLPAQLADGGRLVIPVGTSQTHQMLVRLTREPGGRLLREELATVAFVPLVGKEAW